MFWIDAHAHISFLDKNGLETLLSRGIERDLRSWIMGGYDFKDWEKQKECIERFPQYFKSVLGLHPWRVLELRDCEIEEELTQLAKVLPGANACGETGIDGFRGGTTEQLDLQERVFRAHLEMNRSFNKPLVLHVVRQHGRVQKILKQYNYKGLVHGFSGSYEESLKYIEMGYKISVGKGVCSPGHKGLKECARRLDLVHLVLESDSDKKNDDVVENFFRVVGAVAEIRGVHQDMLKAQNYQNIVELFPT